MMVRMVLSYPIGLIQSLRQPAPCGRQFKQMLGHMLLFLQCQASLATMLIPTPRRNPSDTLRSIMRYPSICPPRNTLMGKLQQHQGKGTIHPTPPQPPQITPNQHMLNRVKW